MDSTDKQPLTSKSRKELENEYRMSGSTFSRHLKPLEKFIDHKGKRVFLPFEVRIIRDYFEKGKVPEG